MPKLLTIDLGAETVKVGEFSTSGRHFKLVEQYAQPVPQSGESIPALANRLVALDALVDEHPQWKGATVALAWPAELASVHRVVLPFTDPAKIDKTLPFTVEGEVPFEMDEMVLGYRTQKQGGKAHVTAVLVRKALLREVLQHLAGHDLDPRAVHLDADLQGVWGTRGRVTAVVDVGHGHTLVSVVRDGAVVAARAVNVAGYLVTNAIQQVTQWNYVHAVAVKHGDLDARPVAEDATEPGRPSGGSGYRRLPEEVRREVDGVLGLLLAEVRSTLISIEDELGLEIDEVKLTGGGSRIAELWDYFAADLGVPVSRLTDADGDPVPPGFAVCHALAAQMVGASEAADLRVGEFAYKGGTDTVRAALTYGISGSVFFALASVVLFAVQYVSLYREQKNVEQQILQVVAETFPEIPPMDDFNMASSVMTEESVIASERAQVLSAINAGVPPTIAQLYALTTSFPPHPTVTVDVSRLQITDEMISFSAETDGYASAGAIEEALKANPLFQHAKKGNENKKGTLVEFPVEIPLRAPEAEEEGSVEEEG